MSHPDIVKHFTVSGRESEVQDIVAKLKFISKLKSGEKFNPQTLQIRNNSYYTSIARTLSTIENRELCYEFILITINHAIELYYFYSCSKEPFYVEISAVLKKALVESKNGLDAQIETYSNQRSFVTKLEALIDMMDAKLQDGKSLPLDNQQYSTQHSRSSQSSNSSKSTSYGVLSAPSFSKT